MRLVLIFCVSTILFSKTHCQKIQTIAFYNVENLFDTLDDPKTFDDDYTPMGQHHWTPEILNQKIDKIAHVLSNIGLTETKKPPLLIGLAEIENQNLIKRIAVHPKLRFYDYEIIHFESPDYRGIDLGLLYRKDFFFIDHVKKYTLNLVDSKTQHKRTTRDQLVITGYWENHALALLVNHWPSRRGGQRKSEASRLAAARLQQRIIDSLQKLDPKKYIISMGDFNDNPNNKSLSLLTKENSYTMSFKPLFNPMEAFFKKGVGSLAYRDRWHLFDQILVDQDFLNKEAISMVKTAVFNPSYLKTPDGKYKGYPYRTRILGSKTLWFF